MSKNLIRVCRAHRVELREKGEYLECPHGHRPSDFIVVDRRSGKVEEEVPLDEAAESAAREANTRHRKEPISMAAPGGPGGKTDRKAKFTEAGGEILWIRIVARKGSAVVGGQPVYSVCWHQLHGSVKSGGRSTKGTVAVYASSADAIKAFEAECSAAVQVGWKPAPILSGRTRVAPIPGPGTLRTETKKKGGGR